MNLPEIPTPNIWFELGIGLFLAFFLIFLGWYPEHLRFIDYIEKQDTIVAQLRQEAKDKKFIVKQIGNEVINEKKADIAAVNKYDFGSLRPSGPNGLPSTGTDPKGPNYKTAYGILARQCATTTVDYDRLVEYLQKNKTLKSNDKQ